MNTPMLQWLQGAGVVDAIIVLVLVEAAALLAYWKLTGRGLRAGALLPNLAAGFFLLLALRAAVHGALWPWLPLLLACAGLAHLVDLRARWHRMH